jgi:hypothetical protein
MVHDEVRGATILEENLMALGARNIEVELLPWRGEGKHEFVGSNTPGLEAYALCIKCRGLKSEVEGDECEGLPV